MINYQLEGKVALVTGASGGIGRAAALGFARSGASVLVADVQDEAGQETVELIRAAGGKAIYQRCDVRDSEQVDVMVAAAVEQLGGLDCAFNNAGIADMAADEYEDAQWERAIGINLSGVMKCMRAEAKVMVKRGGGAIVNTSSINGLTGNPRQPGYVSSKHGVIGLTRHGAMKWAQNHIRVNAVCPGVIETPMTASVAAIPELRQAIEKLTPTGRMGQPEEVAEAVLWLSSSAASFVTGHALVVDGGAIA